MSIDGNPLQEPQLQAVVARVRVVNTHGVPLSASASPGKLAHPPLISRLSAAARDFRRALELALDLLRVQPEVQDQCCVVAATPRLR